MRRLLLSCCLALCFSVAIPVGSWAATGSVAINRWYVRPPGACTFNGDGLAYGCAARAGTTGAFSGFPNIIWTPITGVDNGDTLYVCGAHATMLAPIGGGVEGLPIILRGDCPSDHGTINTVGLSNTTDAIQLLDVDWFTIRHFDRLSGNRHAILVYSTGARRSGFVIENTTVDNRMSASATNFCSGIAFSSRGAPAGFFSKVLITRNTILGTNVMCAGQSNNDGINTAYMADDLTISFNDVAGAFDGIDVSGPIASKANIYGNYSHENRSSGIKIHGGTGCPTRVHVYGNLIVNSGSWGIIFQDVTGGSISSNTIIHFHDGAQTGSPPYGALEVEVAVHPPVVCKQFGNTYANNIFTANYNVGVASIYTDSRAVFEANNTWFGNDLYQRGSQTVLIGFMKDTGNHVTSSNFSTWQSSHAGDVTRAPAFLNAAGCTGATTTTACEASDFRLSPTSTLYRTGISFGACLDVRGHACYPDGPGIGAYQVTGAIQPSRGWCGNEQTNDTTTCDSRGAPPLGPSGTGSDVLGR